MHFLQCKWLNFYQTFAEIYPWASSWHKCSIGSGNGPRRTSNKPLSESMMANQLTHICIIRPRGVHLDGNMAGKIHPKNHAPSSHFAVFNCYHGKKCKFPSVVLGYDKPIATEVMLDLGGNLTNFRAGVSLSTQISYLWDYFKIPNYQDCIGPWFLQGNVWLCNQFISLFQLFLTHYETDVISIRVLSIEMIHCRVLLSGRSTLDVSMRPGCVNHRMRSIPSTIYSM